MSQHTQDPFHHNQNRRIVSETTAAHEVQRASGQAIWRLVVRLRGELILPGDPGYEAARGVWNGAADRRPAMIARCADVEDVVIAVKFAREQALAVSVRSGGHSMAGYGTNDGGLVIDLSGMKAISIDSARHFARLEPGLTWGEVAKALQPSGLALTSGDVSSVGVGGLLLGGGIGWMVRKYGLTIDRLRAVELVTADGEISASKCLRKCRAVLGSAWWRWQLWHRDRLRGGSAPRRDGAGRRGLLRCGRGRKHLASLCALRSIGTG
jgi:FAD/FMN-containing dehydrogenase